MDILARDKEAGRAFRAGFVSALDLFLGLFAVFVVVSSYALAGETFVRGSLLGSFPYAMLVVTTLNVVGAADRRVLRYALYGSWLAGGAFALYISLRLLGGWIDPLIGFAQLAAVPVALLVLSVLISRFRRARTEGAG